VADPEGDNVKLTPLNVRIFDDPSVPGVAMGCGPEPLSTVKTTPVTLDEFGANRFVIGTFRITVKLPVIRAPGVPPLQSKTMSPIRSVIPSPLTGAGVDNVVQLKEAWALAKLKKLLRKNNGTTRYNRRGIYSSVRQFTKLRSGVPRTLIK
jgi:hypothetical protein